MIKKLFGKADEDQYIELDMTEEKGDERVVIQVERLEAFADSERILNKLRGVQHHPHQDKAPKGQG